MDKLWEKMLAALVVSVFGLAAITLMIMLANLFYLHSSAQHWVATSAKVIDWEMTQDKLKNKSVREKISTKYQYTYQNQTYIGNQLDFSLGSDNFSGNRRQKQIEILQKKAVSVWVNPYAPSQSVFDRSLPVSQVTFVIFFLIFPCGLGTLFLWTYLLKGFSKITGIQTDRYAMPLWGFLHGFPALYPLWFGFSALGVGSFSILSLFCTLALYSLVEVIRRVLNPERGVPQLTGIHNFK